MKIIPKKYLFLLKMNLIYAIIIMIQLKINQRLKIRVPKKIINKKKNKIKSKFLFSSKKPFTADKQFEANGIELKASNIENALIGSKSKINLINQDKKRNIEAYIKEGTFLLKKIKMKYICYYYCICCTGKRKTNQKFLLDEGMRLVKENLKEMMKLKRKL